MVTDILELAKRNQQNRFFTIFWKIQGYFRELPNTLLFKEERIALNISKFFQQA